MTNRLQSLYVADPEKSNSVCCDLFVKTQRTIMHNRGKMQNHAYRCYKL